MLITNLIDNISNNPKLRSEHGLSYYIETKNHKLLFDCGQGCAFIDNAKELNIDLNQIDTVVISHGHYDHGGGLDEFLKINNHAKIYLNKQAFNTFYSKKSSTEIKYIGLDKKLKYHPQIELVTGETFVIDENLALYSKINQITLSPLGNQVLIEKRGTQIQEDQFLHEQSLVIREGDTCVLMAGCAHNGIVNIINQISKRSQLSLNYVFGGFHLYNLTQDSYEDDSRIMEIAHALLKTNATFFTGHCTGYKAYELLKIIMHDKIEYNFVGNVKEI